MIGYCRKGDYFLRSKPDTVRQTVATRLAAQRFGIASRKGALIRNAFYDEMDVHCDGSHINRLNKALLQAGRNNTTALTGFRFNQYAGTDRFFTLMPEFSEDGVLHIPAQQLPPLKGITALEVKVIATRISFGLHKVINKDTEVIMLEPGASFAGASLPLETLGKGTLVVMLQVRAICDDIPSRNRKDIAADVITVLETPLKSQVPPTSYKRPYPQPSLSCQREGVLAGLTATSLLQPFVQRE
jgi:hypothetical protein